MASIGHLALALAATCMVVLAACGGGSPPTPSPAATARPATPAAPDPTSPTDTMGLDGRTFLGTGITGRDLADIGRIRLAFAAGRLNATGGCNSMSGPYQVAGGALATGQMATTEMACEEPLMAQDAWLAGFLDGATVALRGATLDLARDGVTLTLTDREVADPDRPLTGTSWVLDGIVAGDAVSSVPAGVTASLAIDGDSVRVETGCNTGGGTVMITDTTIAFGPMAMTAVGCMGGADDVERAMTAVLAGEVAYTIDAGTLTLTAGDAGLVFRAAG